MLRFLSGRRPDARTVVVLAFALVAAAVAAVPALPRGESAKAAGGPSSTFTLVLSNQATGTAPFDAAASCPPASRVPGDVIPAGANSTGTAHCAGMDHSASDNIVRALDTVDVKVDWQLVLAAGAYQIGGQPADSNLTVTMTLPLAPNGQPLATWTAVPGACYITTSGVSNPNISPLSALSSGNRTLTCNIGHKIQGTTGFFVATYRTSGWATDGTKIDLQASIQADTTRAQANPQTTSNTLSNWSSANSNYNLRLDQNAWTVTAGTVPSPAAEPGRLVTIYAQVLQPRGTESIGLSTCCGAGTPRFTFDVDVSRFGLVGSADDGGATQLWQRARLWTWGSNPSGTNSANYKATQAGGAGSTIRVDAWTLNTGVVNPGNYTWVYVYIWLPNAAIPTTNTTVTAALTGFDPRTMGGPNFAGGQSNYGGNAEACLQVAVGQPNPPNCEPGLVRSASPAAHVASNDNEYYLTTLVQYQAPANFRSSQMLATYLTDGDVRSGVYNNQTWQSIGTSAYGTTQVLAPNGSYSDPNAPVLPGAQVLADAGVQNNGSLANTNAGVCVKWDNRTQKLTDFGDATKPVLNGPKNGNPAFAPNSWGYVLSNGTPAYRPGPKWNKTGPFNAATPLNFQVGPAWYTLQFGVGEYTPANVAMSSMNAATCRTADSPPGWFTNPNDPAIQAWIDSTYGPGSGITPLDVVNKARVVLTDDMQGGQSVELVVRLTVRSAWGPTTTGGQAGLTIPGGTRIAMMGAVTDEYVVGLGNNGTTRRNGWLVNNYRPDTDSGAGGDRVTIGSVDVKGATYTMWPNPQGLNSISSVIAGQEVWVRYDPYIYSASGVPAGTPAYPLRAITWLPPQLSYVPSSGCRATTTYQFASCASPLEPVIVSNVDGAGGSALVWDLGSYTPDTGNARTAIEFRTTVDVLSNNGVVARIANVIESKNSDGTSNVQLPVCNNMAAVTNLSIPATTNGPAEVLGVDRACVAYRESAQSITIYNASGLVFSGRAAQQQIEVNDADDGTGNLVSYTVTTKNFNTNAVAWTDQILVLPWNGDGRRPASAYSGAITMQAATTSDVLSAVPNALAVDWTNPPPRSGTTFYWTTQPPAALSEDSADPTNLAGGSTQWCTTAQLGTAGCPATVSAATAVRVISGALAGNGASRTVTVRYSTNGNQRLDVYSLHSIARAGSYALMLRSVDTSMSVVDSSLGGTLWIDADSDGFMQGGETGRLVGVRVDVYDGANNFLASQVTNGAGAFRFSSLHSGTYTVRVVATNGADGQIDLYPALANDYDTDSGSVNSGGFPDLQATFVVARNVQRTDAVFGFATTTLAGKAWRDDNRDGLVDPGEPPLPNKDIVLTGVDDLGASVNRTVQSDAAGLYSFTNLRPGTYTVTTIAQPGSVQPYAGSAGGTINGLRIENVVLLGGMTATNYMFATIAPSVSVTLWVDPNRNLKPDGGERGIPNVRSRIRSRDNTTNAITTDAANTDASGQSSLYS